MIKTEEDLTLINLDLLSQHMSPIRQTFFKALAAQVVVDERDEISRQRLLFTALLREHYDALFNASGGPEDRAAKWEEIRLLMLEQGTQTLVDKDWKYVAGCYWQNIRKESIRRLAKRRTGIARAPRPAQLELDGAVSDIIARRGPDALETVLRNYSKWHEEEEDQQQHMHHQQQHNHQFEHGAAVVTAADVQHGQQQQQQPADDMEVTKCSATTSSASSATVDEQRQRREMVPSTSASPIAFVPFSPLSSSPSSLSASPGASAAAVSVSAAGNNLVPPPLIDNKSHPPAPPLPMPPTIISNNNNNNNQWRRCRRHLLVPHGAEIVQLQHNQRHGCVAATASTSVVGGQTSTTNEERCSPSSASIGKLVARTHSLLLLNGGGGGAFDGMANEFEQQIKQLVIGYKALMFDRLFQPQQRAEGEEEDIMSDQQQQTGSRMMDDAGGSHLSRGGGGSHLSRGGGGSHLSRGGDGSQLSGGCGGRLASSNCCCCCCCCNTTTITGGTPWSALPVPTTVTMPKTTNGEPSAITMNSSAKRTKMAP